MTHGLSNPAGWLPHSTLSVGPVPNRVAIDIESSRTGPRVLPTPVRCSRLASVPPTTLNAQDKVDIASNAAVHGSVARADGPRPRN